MHMRQANMTRRGAHCASVPESALLRGLRTANGADGQWPPLQDLCVYLFGEFGAAPYESIDIDNFPAALGSVAP